MITGLAGGLRRLAPPQRHEVSKALEKAEVQRFIDDWYRRAAAKPDPDTLRMAYQEVCKSHAGIADFRAKLLALLPIVSGAGAFVGFEKFSGPQRWLLGPIGLFGIAATLGLFVYELRGIEDCTMLRQRGKRIEAELGVDGQFALWPPGKRGVVDEIGAGWIVYTAVLASWVLVAAAGFHAGARYWLGYIPAAIVYIGALVIAMRKREIWLEYPGDEKALARGRKDKALARGLEDEVGLLRRVLRWRGRQPSSL